MAKDITTKSIAKDMDRFFNSFFASDRKIPSVNISETDTGYEIKAALADYDEDSISLYVEDHVLHIKGEEKEEKKDNKERKYIVHERSVTSFERSFTLPEDADETKVEASFRKGILSVKVAKMAKEEPMKIEVKIN